jgi:thiol-disulfide isomerase/thioredoxin
LNDSIRRKFKGNDGIPSKTIDSLMVNGIVKYTKDTLLRQMVLTEFINHSFFRSDISIFEGYRQVADSIITLPFLKEPLLKEYKNLKNSLENPQLTSDQIISESKNLSIKEIMETIRSSNKGKVIYLDLWATWCAPCISEFPHSQDLRNTMDNNKVTFVYVCTDSEEKQWLSVIDKYGLEGQHYFLDKEQSSDLSELLNVKGIPFYVIFDKDGNIENKGNHLRPSSGAKEKILALLEE